MKLVLLIIIALFPIGCFAEIKADKVIVDKKQSKLFLIKNEEIIKEYHVVFGGNSKGHKKQEGDERTPEGNYILDYKKADSSFYKAIHISYPNEEDKINAKQSGVNPGGLIMIHGQKNYFGFLSYITQMFNWTNGCIAVNNSDMDEIWDAIEKNTPIEIQAYPIKKELTKEIN